MEDSLDAGRRLAAQFPAQDLKAVILLSQGVRVNGSELIAGGGFRAGQVDPPDGGPGR
jgi:hypothetical protein